MTVKVSAVVVSHDEPDSLARVLEQLRRQTVSPSRVLVVETSKNENSDAFGFETLKLNHKTNFASAIEAAVKHLSTDGHLWILHDDSAPEPQALENLLKEIELSPSLAIVGPKQVDWDNPKLIKQLGLTLTRSGKLFSRVRNEFDQGQHDHLEDVMAVGTAGALINLEKYRELEGFDQKAPELASDVDFSIRARLSGGRVAVAPNAKIAHRMLSMNGKRSVSWLGGTPAHGIRYAELHLALSYANFLGFFFGWLLALPLALSNSVFLLVRKKASDVPAELSAAIAVFFGLGKIIASRSKIKKTTAVGIRTLAGLRATRQEVKSSNQRAKDQEISRQLLEAHARGENDEIQTNPNSGFLASGAIWFALLLVGLHALWIPTNVALTGQGVVPLSANWLEIFGNAGSTIQNLGLGFEGPADPLVWVLAILSAPVFFQPSLAITLLIFLAPAIAFTGVFRLTSLITLNNPIRITTALAYALWPAMTISVSETRFTTILALSALPWLAHSIAKIAGLGSRRPGSVQSIWSEVGISALLLAVVAASSPILGAVAIALILVLGLVGPKRLIPLIFTTGLTAVWFWPVVESRLGSNQILSALMDPGVGLGSLLQANWTLPFFGFEFSSLALGLFITVPVLIFALLSLLTSRGFAALKLWLVGLAALGVAFVAAGISFNFGELVSVQIDLKGLLGLFGLALVLAFAQAASSSAPLKIVAVTTIALTGLTPAAFAVATNPPAVSYSDGRSVPSIIQAEVDANLFVRTLKLESLEGEIAAELIEGDGLKLDELSTSYPIETSGLFSTDPRYQELGQLVANLVSANGADVISPLESLGVGYILVFPKDRDLQMALDSTRGLESIGETDFGQLWKVQSVASSLKQEAPDFGFAKIVTLGVLAFYLLLALPTGFSRKRNGKESAIFVDVEESN